MENKNGIKLFRDFIKGYAFKKKLYILYAIIISIIILTALISLVQPQLQGQVIDGLSNPKKKTMSTFMLLLLVFLMLLLINYVMSYIQKYVVLTISEEIAADMRQKIQDKLATVKGANVNVEDVENMMAEIIAVPIDDGVTFQVKSISEIMDEAEYPGIRVTMTTLFDGVRTPLKIDISTGDAITPKEVRYSFKLMLEDRSIDVWAYNLETVLAEKLETIITRTTTNTRMRDFYDIAILQQLYGSTLDPHVLHDALLATAHKRGTERHLAEAAEVFDEVEASPVMQDLWVAYQKKFSYASDLGWDTVMAAVRQLFVRCEGAV